MREFEIPDETWKTKSTDRFILKWIKYHLSARVTPRLLRFPWLRPWMITLCSAISGVLAGIMFAFGWGFVAGLTAMASQVLDGVDGQFARLTGRQKTSGAFLDSVMDRYADGALLIGMLVYLTRLPYLFPLWQLVTVGALALIGSSAISYTTARADSLGLQVEDQPTLASKGTRTTVIALGGLLTLFWAEAPLVVLWYLAIHSNVVVARRLVRACSGTHS